VGGGVGGEGGEGGDLLIRGIRAGGGVSQKMGKLAKEEARVGGGRDFSGPRSASKKDPRKLTKRERSGESKPLGEADESGAWVGDGIKGKKERVTGRKTRSLSENWEGVAGGKGGEPPSFGFE